MCSAFSHTAFGSKVSSGVVAGSLKFTTALARLIPSSENASISSCSAHLLAIVFRRPAQQAQEVDEGLGQKSGIAIGGHADDRSVAALRELGSIGRDQQRKMRELRRRDAGGFEDQDVLEGVREMVLAADDVADPQIGIVGAGGQVIGRHAVGAQQREVFDVGAGFHLLAVDGIFEANCLPASRGTRKRNAKGSPAAARRSLSSRDSSRIPGLNSHVPCAPDFSLSPGVRRGEVAVSESLLQRSRQPSCGESVRARTACTLRPNSRPSHFNPSKIELTEASVLRSTSVSSRRRIMVPPFRRA